MTYNERNLAISMNNYEAARSRIADADFAREPMETGTAALAQANATHGTIPLAISGSTAHQGRNK